MPRLATAHRLIISHQPGVLIEVADDLIFQIPIYSFSYNDSRVSNLGVSPAQLRIENIIISSDLLPTSFPFEIV